MVVQHPEDEFLFLFDRPFDARYVYAKNVTPVRVFPPARHTVLFYSWFEWSIPRVMERFGAEVFFSPDSMCSLRSAIPTVMTVHDIVPIHFPEQIPFLTRHYLLNMLPKFLDRADRVLTVSNYVKQDIVQHCGIYPEKISVVYNGCREGFVPMEGLDKQAVREQFADGREYFFYTGAIHPRKNIHRLIRAFDLFKDQTGAAVQLLLAGRFAWQTGEVKSAYEAARHQDDIQFLGYVPEADLTRLMASALALAYVSLSEGFGLPMLEAMNAGIPVLAADASCLPEVAAGSALLVDPNSEQAMAEGLGKLYRDRALRADLIARGNRRKADFSWDVAADEVYALLKNAAAGKPAKKDSRHG